MEDALRADDGVGGRSIGRSTLTATVSLSLVAVVAKASARAMIQAEAMATSVVEVMTVELAEETLQMITEKMAESAKAEVTLMAVAAELSESVLPKGRSLRL